jgi:hypothetical protein
MNSAGFEKYKRIQERFGLPQLNELKEIFKLEIEDDNVTFDEVRIEISDKLFMFNEKIIEPIISGYESFSSMYEQGMLSEKDVKNLFKLYKKIQVLKWENNLLMLKPDEKATAAWIKKVWAFWNQEFEPEIGKICKKLSESWQNLEFKDEKAVYHG